MGWKAFTELNLVGEVSIQKPGGRPNPQKFYVFKFKSLIIQKCSDYQPKTKQNVNYKKRMVKIRRKTNVF